MPKQKAEGKIFAMRDKSEIRDDLLLTEVFDDVDQIITCVTEEFSAVCPFSGLPDFAELTIQYRPRSGKILELKSLKYYVVSFYGVGIYQEEATSLIFDTLLSTLGITEKDLYVKMRYNLRGGFDTTTECGTYQV